MNEERYIDSEYTVKLTRRQINKLIRTVATHDLWADDELRGTVIHLSRCIEAQCPECDNYFPLAPTGRPGKYCSDACKQRAYRRGG